MRNGSSKASKQEPRYIPKYVITTPTTGTWTQIALVMKTHLLYLVFQFHFWKKKKKCLDKKTTVSVRKSGYIDYSYEKDQYQNVKAIIYSSNDWYSANISGNFVF